MIIEQNLLNVKLFMKETTISRLFTVVTESRNLNMLYKIFQYTVENFTVRARDSFLVALCNRETIYIFMLWLVLSSSFFSSPNLSGRRLDVYHTLAHGVALVRI